MMQTDSQHVVEFSRVENVQTEPELLSYKMNWSTCRGTTFVDCAGSPVFRHGNDGEIHDCHMVGDVSLTSPTGSAKSTGGFRGYGRGHKVHHNTIRVNGNTKFERPILLDGGDTSPDALANGHAHVVGWTVEKNLLVKCGAWGGVAAADRKDQGRVTRAVYPRLHPWPRVTAALAFRPRE